MKIRYVPIRYVPIRYVPKKITMRNKNKQISMPLQSKSPYNKHNSNSLPNNTLSNTTEITHVASSLIVILASATLVMVCYV